MRRRDFLASAIAGGVAIQLGCGKARAKPVPKRRYNDEVELSVIGFGGIVVVGQEQEAANRAVAKSIDRGINYFDVAPTYGKGEAEQKLGIALKPYREDVFLACKTQKRDAGGAREELEQSLRQLHTDHFDLYQFHAVRNMDDVEKILGPDGAAEAFLKARQEGKVRYLGFSAHSTEAALALLDRFEHVDSVLFPVNFTCYAQGNFGPRILEKAKQKGAARMALKALAHSTWPEGTNRKETKYPKCWYKPVDLENRELVCNALRFTLSEDITAAIPPGDERLYQLALDLAADLEPMTPPERDALLASTAGLDPIFRA